MVVAPQPHVRVPDPVRAPLPNNSNRRQVRNHFVTALVVQPRDVFVPECSGRARLVFPLPHADVIVIDLRQPAGRRAADILLQVLR